MWCPAVHRTVCSASPVGPLSPRTTVHAVVMLEVADRRLDGWPSPKLVALRSIRVLSHVELVLVLWTLAADADRLQGLALHGGVDGGLQQFFNAGVSQAEGKRTIWVAASHGSVACRRSCR